MTEAGSKAFCIGEFGLAKHSRMRLRILNSYFRDDKTVRDNDGNPWRHGFLLERGKMTTDRFRKIKDTMMFGQNSSFSHVHSANFINFNTFGNHTPIHVLSRVSRQERLAIGTLERLYSHSYDVFSGSTLYTILPLQNASSRDFKPRAKCFSGENASKRRTETGKWCDATTTTR